VTDGDGDTSTAQGAFNVTDTQTNEQVTLTASAVSEGSVANYTFTATLADPAHNTPVTVTILDGNNVSHDITIGVGRPRLVPCGDHPHVVTVGNQRVRALQHARAGRQMTGGDDGDARGPGRHRHAAYRVM